MAEKASIGRTALVAGLTVAVLHTLVVLLARLGLVDLWLRLHLLVMPVALAEFDIRWFIAGIVTAFISGCVIGVVYAFVRRLAGFR